MAAPGPFKAKFCGNEFTFDVSRLPMRLMMAWATGQPTLEETRDGLIAMVVDQGAAVLFAALFEDATVDDVAELADQFATR